MSMRTMQIELPEALELSEREVRMTLAVKLYELGKLSLGKAAELAGYSKATFMELLSDYGVSTFQTTQDELMTDVANAKRYHKR